MCWLCTERVCYVYISRLLLPWGITSEVTACMSRIFDSVNANSSRRKAHILDGPSGRNLFELPGISGPMLETGMLKTHVVGTTNVASPALAGAVEDDPFSKFRFVVDGIWICCTACILTPVCWFVWDAVYAETVSVKMAGIPYKCSMFYLGLFVGLPGASVYVFCCTLVFFKRGKIAILMCMLSIFVFVCTVERKCMVAPSADTSVEFYMLATSIFAGISSQAAFVGLTTMSDERRHTLFVVMGLAGVLVLLSVLAVTLAGTQFDQNFTKASCYITSTPLAAALVIYVLSTYSTLDPIRSVCRHI